MRIGILGSGMMGGKLGTLFAGAGDLIGKVPITFSLPMNDDSALVVGHTSSGAEKLAKGRWRSGARVPVRAVRRAAVYPASPICCRKDPRS